MPLCTVRFYNVWSNGHGRVPGLWMETALQLTSPTHPPSQMNYPSCWQVLEAWGTQKGTAMLCLGDTKENIRL